MNIEENRLKTFAQWPENASVNSSRMARGGFYYTGNGMDVQCFLCGIRISDWNYGDQVMSRHRQAEPSCPFVQDPGSTCNVPLIDTSRLQPTPSSSSGAGATAATNGETSQALRPRQAPGVVHSKNPRIEYGNFSQRLRSFDRWPGSAPVTPEHLARSGFYYLQHEHMVECAFCGGILIKWEPGDDPGVKHRSTFPDCDFYSHQESNSALSTEKEELLGNVKLLSGANSDLSKLGIQRHIAPRQPKHATYEGRLRTFRGWPENLRQTPEMLAIAGFYSVGSGDQVRCFHCDGGLHNWETDDDPWTEHARWFSTCPFVAMVRGQEFINHCIDNRPPLDPLIFLGVPEDGEDVPGSAATSQQQQQQLPPTISSLNVNSTPRIREVSDSEVEQLLLSEPALAALQIGFQVGSVKMALRQRLETVGSPYTNANQLMEHVRHIQLAEESNGLDSLSETSSLDLANLLSQVINVQSASGGGDSPCRNSNENDVRMRNNYDGEKRDEPEHSHKDKRLEKKFENGTNDCPLSLEEENRRLKEARLCKICMDREVSVVFLPCGHLSTCVHCAPSLADCPMCRQEIRATVRTFLA